MDASSRRSPRSHRWVFLRHRSAAAVLVVCALALAGCGDFSTAAAPFTVQPSLTDPIVTPVLPQPLAPPSTAQASAPPSSGSPSSSAPTTAPADPCVPTDPAVI